MKKRMKETGEVSAQQLTRLGTVSGGVGMLCNLLLSALKITAGLLTGSISVVGDGINNLSDMGSGVISLVGLRLASKPADKKHPYGHGRAEYLSAFLVAVMILLFGLELLKSSVTALFSARSVPEYSAFALGVLALSVVVKFGMFCLNRRLYRISSSDVFSATASDSINDCLATGAILLCSLISRVWPVSFDLDAVLGILLAGFVLYSGVRCASATAGRLLGEPPDPQLISKITETVLSFEEFRGIHDLTIHDYGAGRRFATVHVEVPQTADIVRCHEQADLCEKTVEARFGVALTIHVDPIDTDNEAVNQTRKAVFKALQHIRPKIGMHDFRMTPKNGEQTNLIFDVVLPAEDSTPPERLIREIEKEVQKIDPSFCCRITVDRDFGVMQAEQPLQK